MRQILTDAACKTKPPASGRLEIADLRQAGLALRITSKGARSFAYRYRHPDTRKPLRITLGTYPTTTLEAARKRAREMAAQVEAGVNPTEHKRAEREKAPTRSFEALAMRYLKEHAERHKRPRSIEEDRRNLQIHILPKWGKRDFRNIRRSDIIELIEAIVGDGKHTAANRVHALVSSIFNFAIDSELLEANPATRLKKRGKEQARRRTLSDGEIRLFYNGIIEAPTPRLVGLALRLALLTGTRASEVAGARKSELEHLDDRAKAVWLIPASRIKNKSDHLVPLAPLALETIREAGKLAGDSDFLFPALRSNGKKHVTRQALPAAMQDFGARQGGTWGANPPVPHDLRRTVNTWLAKAGISREVRDRCLNHLSGQGDIETTYNRYEFQKEKRAAFGAWAKHISSLVRGYR
jgi:integrase